MIRSSVIIPLFNEVDTIKRLILSLQDQSMPSDEYQVIAVDDCSTDGTREYLQSLNFKGNFKLIVQKENLGLSSGRNRGIEASDSDILLFIDGDMEVGHDWVASHTLPIENGEWDGSLGSVTHSTLDRTLFIKFLDRSDRGAKKHPNEQVGHKHFQFWNTSIRKELLTNVGGFDEKISLWGGEDIEMVVRIENFSHPVLRFNPKAKAVHYQERSLEDTFTLMTNFGAKVVPYLVEKHPFLSKEFKTNYLDNPISRKVLKMSFFNPIFFQMVKTTYKLMPDVIAFHAIKYLLGYSVFKGYLSNLIQRAK